MGMYGRWLRVSSAELARAKSDPAWAGDFARAMLEHPAEPDLTQCRAFSTDKAWHALAYLLHRRGFPVDLIFGEQPLSTGGHLDWGYGPPRYLSPAQVNLAAAELVTITGEDLVTGVEPVELTRAQIYPNVWDRPAGLPWITAQLTGVRTWFGAAAAAGDAVLCWID